MLFVGIDWAERHHDVSVIDMGGLLDLTVVSLRSARLQPRRSADQRSSGWGFAAN